MLGDLPGLFLGWFESLARDHCDGTILVRRGHLVGTFQLQAEGRTRVVQQTHKLEHVNDCFEQLEMGEVGARSVSDFR